MDAKYLFNRCLDLTDEVISKVKLSEFSLPTPDTEWSVRDLITHMLRELSWVPSILGGLTIAQVGDKYDGDLIGNDLRRNWSNASKLARKSVDNADLIKKVHLSFGEFPSEYYIRQQANDQYIHAWDLGTALGNEVKFDPEISEELYRESLPRKKQLASSGLFKPPVDISESGDIQAKLLALFGRSL